MKTNIIVAAVLILGSASLCAASGEPNLRDGMWEITTSMEMPGMPAAVPPVKSTQCITKKNAVPQAQDLQNQDCTMSTPSISGNTVTWTVDCKGEDGPVKGTGKITYNGDAFDGTLTMTMQEPEHGAGLQIVQRMNGKRIGECK